MIAVQCDQCGKELQRWPHQVERGPIFYCSPACRGRARAQAAAAQRAEKRAEGLLLVPEAARMVNRGPKMLEIAVCRGDVPMRVEGGRWWVRESDVLAWARKR